MTEGTDSLYDRTFDFDMNLNLSMCGCGFLGMYHLGVASCLVKHGQGFLSSVEKIAGASAGSLIAAVLVISQDKLGEAISFTKGLAKEVKKKPFGVLTPGYNLLKSVERFLDQILPENAHELATGRLFISLTHADTKKNIIMSEFESREELIKVLIASSHIPLYARGKPPKIRGKRYMDGGFTDNLPSFKDGRTVFVSPFAGRQDICPRDRVGKGMFFTHGNQDYQLNFNNIVRGTHAFFPPSSRMLQQYFERGHQDAGRFLRNEGWFEIKSAKIYQKKYVMQFESAV